MDMPVLHVPMKKTVKMSVDDKAVALFFGLLLVAVVVGIGLVGSGMLGLYVLSVGSHEDAWMTWWQSIWAPIVALIGGIVVGISGLVGFLNTVWGI